MDQSAAAEKEQALRRSDRIRYAFRIQIAGTDSAGHPYDTEALTDVVTRDGGLLATSQSLKNGSQLTISRADKQVTARVVAQVGVRGEDYLYGFHFLPPAASDFWDINFPDPQATPQVGRTVLQCSRCSRQELLHLGEVDLMVYEQTRTVPHECEVCKQETLWQKPVLLGDNGLVTGSESYLSPLSAPERKARKVNDRKHPRVALKNIKACLKRQGYDDDVVDVLDMSRGGIRFLSLVDYPPDTQITVAVPYMSDGANVFLPAKIARVRCRPTLDIPGEFGLQYKPR
ncbi:MAG TPA: PilZ domain-containing protein [Terriglobales bacterium]|nr:PilZ domain-containing protein [Terriglobales bacterium]